MKEWVIGGAKKSLPDDLHAYSVVPASWADRFVALCEKHQPPWDWLTDNAKKAGVEKFSELPLGEYLRMVVAIERNFWISGNDIDLTATDEIPDYSTPG